MPTIQLLLYLCFTLLLISCSTDLRKVSPIEIQNLVTISSPHDGENHIWTAPELQVRHYRTLFYGYDTVYYRLIADKSIGEPTYRLQIDANYGGAERHYILAKLANGTMHDSQNHRHEIERCQFFNNMVSSCLYRDRADIELKATELEAHKQDGLLIILSSTDKNYESIDLPADYITGFLNAVNSQ